MFDLSIDVIELKEILLSKDIDYLYHVNTVTTALTFLEQGGLLSRGAVEDRGLPQTWQKSDDTDKEVGVFYDIFFDSVDIHERSKSLNFYGPVTFVYSIDVLDSLEDELVKITKSNPINWSKGMTEEERYFLDKMDVIFNMSKGTFKQHITICEMREPLYFDTYLQKVVLDNPRISNNSYFDTAAGEIQSLLEAHGLPDLVIRDCPDVCKCYEEYSTSNRKDIDRWYKID